MSNNTAVLNKLIAKFTTPQILKGGLYLTWCASVLMLISTISGIQAQKQAIQTVAKDATRSIIDAQRIKDSLADMDASAANELLAKPGENPEASKNYKSRSEKAMKLLVSVTENITYDDAERKPITIIQVGINEYIAKIQQARDAHQRNDFKGLLTAYREATEILDKTLLPAADALDKVNSNELEKEYNKNRYFSIISLLSIIFSDLLLISILIGIQLFLTYRMRRIFNIMLLIATAIAIIFTGYTTQVLLSSSDHLKLAKEDAFDSLHVLRKARALAYSANGDESRYLLDPDLAVQHERSFFTKIEQIVKLPPNQTWETVANDLKNGKKIANFSGYLAEEFNNITFDGEKEAALETVRTLGIYLTIDKQIRQLKTSGQYQEAIALCLSNETGKSNWAFEEFRKANSKTMDINQKVFDEAIKKGFNSLLQPSQEFKGIDGVNSYFLAQGINGFLIITPVVGGAIAILTLLGLKPRLKEYSE